MVVSIVGFFIYALVIEAQYPGFNAPLGDDVGDAFAVVSFHGASGGESVAQLPVTPVHSTGIGIYRDNEGSLGFRRSRAKRLDSLRISVSDPLLSASSAAWQGLDANLVTFEAVPVKIKAHKTSVAFVFGETDDERRSTHAPTRALSAQRRASSYRNEISRREPARIRRERTAHHFWAPID